MSSPLGGGSADGPSRFAVLSGDGARVAYQSTATNLVPGHGTISEVVLDAGASTVSNCVSTGVGDTRANAPSGVAALNSDGSIVVFESLASNLVLTDTNRAYDVFAVDTASGKTSVVSCGVDADVSNGDSRGPAVSSDGRYVAFTSSGSDLVPGDTNGMDDVFVRDLSAGTTLRVSVSGTGGEADADSGAASISGDGRYVAFSSAASNLVAGDTNGARDIFVRDLVGGTIVRASVGSSGVQANLGSFAPALDADGSRVSFESLATNLVAGDGNGTRDVFVRDIAASTTLRASATGSVEGDGESREPAISADGSKVAFTSSASNLVSGDTNGSADVFVADLAAKTVTRISVSGTGAQANGPSAGPSVSADGSSVAFHSDASNLVDGDANNMTDVFVARWAPRDYVRLGGKSRYDVNIAESRRAFPGGAPAVVVATGANWPDALGGSALAGVVGGPLLLTPSAALLSSVRGEIVRLGARKAYIVGGPASVSPAVESALVSLLGRSSVVRLGGRTRYDVAAAIGTTVATYPGTRFDGTVLVTTGGKWPDALSGSPIATLLHRPIALCEPVTGSVRLPAGTTSVVILGGPGSVSTAVEVKLKARFGAARVRRLGGADRYAAAATIAQWGVDECGLAWDGTVLSSGENFPDALGGGVMGGTLGVPLVLVTRATLPGVTSTRLTGNASTIRRVYVTGGTATVSDGTVAKVKQVLGD